MHRFGISVRPTVASFLAICLLGVSCLGTLRLSLAQDALQQRGPAGGAAIGSTDPVLVVTIASMNKLMQDVNYITGVLGQPQAGGMFTMMAGTFTQGLDNTRPIGLLVPMVEGSPAPVAVVPTRDVEMMLKRLEAQTGPADKLDDGTLVVAAGTTLVYVRQVGSWAVIAQSRELIDLVPADPMPLMQGLGDDYDLALRLNVQEVPLELRELLVDQLSQGFEQALARQEDSDQNVVELGAAQLEQIKKLVREADQLMLGLNINPNKRIVSIDTKFTAADGTSLARVYSSQLPIPSMFSAVLGGDPALRYHAAASVSPELIEMSTSNLDSLIGGFRKAIESQDNIDDAIAEDLEEMLRGLLEIVEKTMQEGKFDIGTILLADDGVFRMAGGTFVHDGKDVADWVKSLAGKLRDLPDAPDFRFDEGQYNGIDLHSVVIDVPAKEAELRRIFGEQAVIKLGTGPQAVYFAIGDGSVDMMNRLIDTAGDDRGDLADRPLGQMRVKLLPILRLVQSIKPNDALTGVIDAVALGGNNDYLAITNNTIPNGQSSYIEIGEGLIKAIGAGIREAQNAQMREMQRGGGQF